MKLNFEGLDLEEVAASQGEPQVLRLQNDERASLRS